MKKNINKVEDIVEEMVKGIEYASNGLLTKIKGQNILVLNKEMQNDQKVSLICGGGSGHEPSHAGFVGLNMLDAAVCGQIFSSPTAFEVLETIKNVPNKNGVLLIIKNYSGDIMNFNTAKDLALIEGIKVETLIIDDDIALENSLYTQGRRGIAGTVLIYKILGCLASRGYSLEALKKYGEKLNRTTKSFGFGLKPCTVLSNGKESFKVNDDEIEFGCGIHGEPGVAIEKHTSSKKLVLMIMEKFEKELVFLKEKKYIIFINGLGGTTLIEQYIFCNDVVEYFKNKKIEIEHIKVGTYMSSLNMEGISLTILEVFDDLIVNCLDEMVKIVGNLF